MAYRQITPPTLAEVMQQHPQLGSFGIGVFNASRKTAGQRQAELAADRAKLAGREAIVMETAAWLWENITSTGTPTVSSYTVLHVVERATGRYVSNGDVIAAALIAGYSFEYDQPNVLFGMSDRDLAEMN
ncbi:hypothetical protein AB0D49_13580 [Streptomyces sp. NPDC048290]|uniref:hypothetical protein n=1 Tax=Streptomyces sp. NPDC048290 TaxID=3155811 RepID=UPI003434D64F